jgi:hypothetical protein
MTTPIDVDLQALKDDWTASPAALRETTPERVRRHVRHRSRLFLVWIVGEAVVGFGMLAFLAWMAVARPDPVERLAMVLFAVITVGALAFACWNWLTGRPPVTETTATYLAVSEQRCRALSRAVRAAWVILAAEAVVFVPFLGYTVGSPASRPAPWLFLAVMLAAGAGASDVLGRWTAREKRIVDEMRRDLEA